MIAEFDAPIELVWQLWAHPRRLERWTAGYPATVPKHDVVPGGEVTYFMTGPGGETSHGWWHVTLVEAPRSLDFTDGFAKEDGTPDPEMPTHRVQVRLAEQDGRTRMELRFMLESPQHMEQLERLGAFEGIRRPSVRWTPSSRRICRSSERSERGWPAS